MAEKETLTQRLVTRYAKYNALKNLLENWLRAQRDKLLEALKSGERCPDRGPYLLELGDAEKRVDWQEEFRLHLMRTGYPPGVADDLLKRIVEKEREREPRLHVKVNPNYGRKVEIRLPAG